MTQQKNDDMVWIPGGLYHYHATHRFREGGFILFDEGPRTVEMAGFFMDRYEVTNAQYLEFMEATGYHPVETHNFLRHWQRNEDGKIRPPADLLNHPVVWVCREDARAYAAWAGKRLPYDIEWQRAGQGDDGRKWPWGNEFNAENCNSNTVTTSPVDAYPMNRSPFGVTDMVGNVWEWTEDNLTDGWNNWCLIRGGSYYKALGSMWYVEGGAQPVHHHHKFLLMNPSLDRCGTVGFRCARSEGPTVLRGYIG